MKRYTTYELNCMLSFFKTNLPDEKSYEPLVDLLYYSINLEYRSISIENLGVIYSIENAFRHNLVWYHSHHLFKKYNINQPLILKRLDFQFN